MKTLRRLLACILSFIALVACAACGGNVEHVEQETVNVNLDKNISGKITVGVYNTNLEDLLKVIKEFNKVYPNIRVITKNQADTDRAVLQWHKADEKVAGASPDIFWFATESFAPLADGGILMDLTPWLNASYEAGILKKENLVQEAMATGTLDGKQYLIPTHNDRIVTLVNKTILEKAGIKMPTAEEWTWEKFEEISAEIQSKYSSLGIASGIKAVNAHWESNSVVWPILKAHGVQVADENNNITLDSTATREALAFLREQVNKPYTAYNGSGNVSGGNVAFQFQSRSAMAVPTPLEGREFPEVGYFGKDDLDVLPFPALSVEGVNKIYYGFGSHGYAMYKRSRNQNLAWAFLQFLLSEQAQDAFGEAGLHVPMLKSMQSNTENTDWNWLKVPKKEMNHSAFISNPERNVATDFHLQFPSKIRSAVYEAVLLMAQEAMTTQKLIDDLIDTCVQTIEFEMSKV